MKVNIKNRYSLIHLGILILIFAISNITGIIYFRHNPDIDEYIQIAITLVLTIVIDISLLFYIFIVLKKDNADIRNELRFFINWKDILWGFVAFISAILILTIYSMVIPIEEFSWVESYLDILINGPHYSTIFLMFLFGSIIAPFVEEILFRGYIWKILEEKKINKYMVLLITSFLFASMHLELYNLPVFFIFGIILGYLRMRTNRMGASLLAHIIKNTFALIIIYSGLIAVG